MIVVHKTKLFVYSNATNRVDFDIFELARSELTSPGGPELFSPGGRFQQKMFAIDGIYNSQNDRIWAVDRAEADTKGGIQPKRKFLQKVMFWLGVCSKSVSPLVIFEKGTRDHARYIEEVLPVALKYGNKVLGNEWTFQQDGAKPPTHAKAQKWCIDNFPSFIDKDRWPADSPD